MAVRGRIQYVGRIVKWQVRVGCIDMYGQVDRPICKRECF